MEVIFVLVPVSLVIVIAALWAFVWSVRNDQFDDLDKEAYSILFDDDKPGTDKRDAGDENIGEDEQKPVAGSSDSK
jgi:cbb3-type cytochrome oxidase maturation protein